MRSYVTESRGGFLDKSAKLAGIVGDKAVELARVARLRAEINSEKEKIRKAQLEIGKVYYESCSKEPHPALKECCERIDASFEVINQKLQKIDDLKSSGDGSKEDSFN